jgi:DNA-binding response OmpR family regulator
MRVLVVEDEEGIADFVRRGLEAEGYDVTCAFDGVEGEAQALSGEFDLVVLDQMLPGRDGLAVLGAVRESLPGLPVILLTARDDVADRIVGLDAGAVDYMTKPFAFDELAARVRAHLRQPETARPTRLEAGGIVVDLIRRRVARDASCSPSGSRSTTGAIRSSTSARSRPRSSTTPSARPRPARCWRFASSATAESSLAVTAGASKSKAREWSRRP